MRSTNDGNALLNDTRISPGVPVMPQKAILSRITTIFAKPAIAVTIPDNCLSKTILSTPLVLKKVILSHPIRIFNFDPAHNPQIDRIKHT